MMSRMEKNAQVGDLVQQRQDARIALEHLKLKGKKIAAAYSVFGSNQDRWCIEAPAATDVFLRYPKGPESDHPSHLLGRAELTEHVREVVAAEAVLANIKAQLASLGIAD
jgi:hypothetical protein